MYFPPSFPIQPHISLFSIYVKFLAFYKHSLNMPLLFFLYRIHPCISTSFFFFFIVIKFTSHKIDHFETRLFSGIFYILKVLQLSLLSSSKSFLSKGFLNPVYGHFPFRPTYNYCSSAFYL